MSEVTSAEGVRRTRLWLIVVITVILVGWALQATGAFMVPVVFSVFMALLVAPLDRRVAERVPDRFGWLGHVAAMGAILVTLLVFVGLIWIAAQQIVERFPMPEDGGNLLPPFGAEDRGDPSTPAADDGATQPEIVENAGSTAAEGTSAAEGIFDRLRAAFRDAGDSLLGSLGEWISGIAMQVLGAAGATLGAAVVAFFLTLFMLIEGPKWRQKIVNVLDPSARQTAMEAIGIIAQRLRRYLLARTMIGLITAFLYVSWLWFFGVDLLVVWALLAFLLNYIPTIGSLIAGILPALYAFVQKDFATAMMVGTGVLVIEQIMGNYLDPLVQGRQVSLSSLVVLITLLLWSWIWGIAGAVLAVPITIAVMIVCAHVGPLRPFALMLSSAGDMEELDRETSPADELSGSEPY